MIQRVPLSATEEAFVAMVIEEHTALIRQADARREQRMKVLLAEKAIPDGVPVRTEKAPGESRAALVYDDGVEPPSEEPSV